MIINDEHHFFAICKICDAVGCALELLPETDVVVELTALMEAQKSILHHMIHGQHYGTQQLMQCIENVDQLILHMNSLKEGD